jgi:hypothetical protein
MLDVHAPHGKLHGIKDFFLHLFTITLGLLIALSLEGWVESAHHRHLAQEAEDGLRTEIAHNAQQIGTIRQNIENGQKQLETDVKALEEMRAHPHAKRETLKLGVDVESLDNISWKTAQNTGAIAYIPYRDAQSFSDIYLGQDEYWKEGTAYLEDIGSASSLFIAHPGHWNPSPAQIDMVTDRIGKAQWDLNVLHSSVDQLDRAYKAFESKNK